MVERGLGWRAIARAAAVVPFALVIGAGACGARTGLRSEQCVALDAAAEQSSLVVFLMLDTSGSMEWKTAEGETKAKAVRDALADFLADPASEGLGVAAALFPISRPEVPLRCHSDEDCGEPLACRATQLKMCLPDQQKTCDTDADCQAGGSTSDACYEVGLCADDVDKPCVFGMTEQFCNPGVECLTWSSCLNRVSCDAPDYAKPVVDVGTLPAVRQKILLALDTHVAEGGTPTLPAVSGALAAASAWQDAHPNDKAIVLLATDGFPTMCDPAITTLGEETTEGIPAVVLEAKAGVADGVQTFVVGVFTPEEEQLATFALGEIALAGGTESAFIVTTDGSVSAELVARLSEIRARAHACEYSIPWPAQGGIDPDSLDVTLDTGVVPRVASAAACDPHVGGFYFDREPQPGELPHRVILCPASCGAKPPNLIHLKGRCRVVHH